MTESDAAAPVSRDQLAQVFVETETSPSDFLIGAEGEKIGVHQQTGAPLGYGQPFGVCKVLGHLEEHHGWTPMREGEGAPTIGLRRACASVTLEPSAQLELSGAPLPDLHAIALEKKQHLHEIADVSDELGVAWLATGFHPLAKLDELPWIPKMRYPIMRKYLPQKGPRGLDMMQRTATVQANYDWSSERDGMSKLSVALKLSPIIHALFANAPFKEGKAAGKLSERGAVWLGMDPSRSGLVAPLWSKKTPSYDDYVEWALDAGMFLFKRDDEVIANTGQTFRSFLEQGYQGHHATLDDWRLHLSTLFPEVRLKNTLEVRPVDGLGPRLAMAAIALWTGILYDDAALDGAAQLTEAWSFQEMQAARPALVTDGLHAALPFTGGLTGWQLADKLVGLARSGLTRRGRAGVEADDEAVFLAPVDELIAEQTSPAQQALDRVAAGASLIEAVRLPLRY